MTIRIGANPIGWSNDDMPELGGETPLETCLAEAKSAGLEGMELGNKFPREATALKAALAPFGLACIGGWHSILLLERDADAEIAAARAHMDLLKAMGSTVFIAAECSNTIHGTKSAPLSTRPVITDAAVWAEYGRRLTKLAEATKAEGLQLVYHFHMGTFIQNRAEIGKLMDATGPAVGLLLDTGHATWGGSDPVELARTYRHRIFHIHCKDVRPDVRAKSEAGDWSFLDSVIAGVYTVPGDGTVDYTGVFRELPGYSGWVVIEAEQDPAVANPLAYCKMGYAHLTRVLAETGLRP
jgi:myo-inosose-2 dehydratase